MNASLEVELSSPAATALAPRLHAMAVAGDEPDSYFAVTVSRLSISSASSSSSSSSSNNNGNDAQSQSVAAAAPASATASSSATSTTIPSRPAYAAVFLPATVTESALDPLLEDRSDKEGTTSGTSPDVVSTVGRAKVSKRLLAMVHPFLAENFSIKGIVAVRNERHAPADIVLVDLSHTPTALLDELLLHTTSGEQVIFAGQPELILKVLLVYHLEFCVADSKPRAATTPDNTNVSTTTSTTPSTTTSQSTTNTTKAAASTTPLWHGHRTQLEIPNCPVCIHRIEPMRLGLPKPFTHQVCSKFCTPPNLFFAGGGGTCSGHDAGSACATTSAAGGNRLEQRIACPRQRLLLPWPRPSHCAVCRQVEQYWQAQGEGLEDNLYCTVCSMQQTLWVCMTCAFLGCGRYSNKHAADHFVDSGHPFSLELATLRIWDYVTGGFVQRTDFLECPSALPLLQPWVAASRPRPMAAAAMASIEMSSEKTPKKATMIGEEYEALLQSALEEQAQHYEGELTHLRAQLTAEHVDRSAMTPTEGKEVEGLQGEIARMMAEIDRASQELLDAQAQEAAQRTTSQNLLRHQQSAADVLAKLEDETAQEREAGRTAVEELEQQIADLTANQRMRHQFTQNEELNQAQIWGITSSSSNANNARGKKGKKQRRVRR